MKQGWIAIHREIEDNILWLSEPFSRGQAWIDLILMANHQENKILHDGNIETVGRGEKVTSLRYLSDRWSWSRTKTKKFLELLQNEEMITYKSTTKKTTYKIVNYNKYQDKDSEEKATEKPQKNIRKTSERHQKETNNNVNNDNNDKQDIRSTKFDSVIEEWNSLDKNISNIQTINSGTTRHKLLQARINEYGEDKVLLAIRNINNSSFLKGYKKDWKITFDWFVKPNNFIKVLENNYADEINNNSFGNNKPLSDIEKENLRRVKEMFGGND